MKDLELFQISGSPNNTRARVALGYKGLEYESWHLPMNEGSFPYDRSHLVEISGQPRTPVLRHGKTVIFDSGAIMRYLEANFRDTPRLFRDGWQAHGQIEEWELWVKTDLAPPIRAMFGQAMAPDVDRAIVEKACADLHAATARLEQRLAESEFLIDGAISAADVSVSPAIGLAMIEPSGDLGPIHARFAEHLHLGEDRERTATWARKLLAFDRG